MKKLLFTRILLLALVSLFVLGSAAFAEEGVPAAAPAQLEFAVTEAEDVVDVTLTVKSATIMGVQLAVRYDPAVLAPVNEAGEPTIEFDDFAVRSDEAAFFNIVGPELDAEKGLFGLTLYIMPGTKHESINESNECVIDENGLDLYSFRFKRIAEGDTGLEIAVEDETKPYQEACAEGVIIMDYTTGALTADVSFVYEDVSLNQTETILPVKPGSTAKPDSSDKTDDKQEDETPAMTQAERKKDVICLQIDNSMTVTYGKKVAIDENDQVVPYITGDRTLVPLRYVSEALGAEVIWVEGVNGCTIKKDDVEIEITFGSAEFTVNGETIVYEAPIEVVHERTMVPVRFVSEQLGCDVYWSEQNRAVVISPMDNPWIEDREAEKIALNEMLVSMMGIL